MSIPLENSSIALSGMGTVDSTRYYFSISEAGRLTRAAKSPSLVKMTSPDERKSRRPALYSRSGSLGSKSRASGLPWGSEEAQMYSGGLFSTR